MAALGLLVVLFAVLTFHPTDSSTFTSVLLGRRPVWTEASNLLGPWGAELSAWAWELFGFGAPVGSLLLLGLVLIAYRSGGGVLLRALGFLQLFACLVGVLHVLWPSGLSWRGSMVGSGGLLGMVLGGGLAGNLGPVGALIALAAGIAASFPLVLGLRPLALIVRVLTWAPSHKVRALARNLNAIDEPATEAGETSVTVPPASAPLLMREPLAPMEMPRTPERREEKCESDKPGSVSEHAPIAAPSGVPARGPMWDNALFTQLLGHLQYHKGERKASDTESERERLTFEARALEEKLGTFGVAGTVVHSQPGPVVNLHEFEPAPGVKVSRVLGLQDDLALGLKAQSVLMAPQPGKSTIGVEIPAGTREAVSLREILESKAFKEHRGPLPLALGKLVDGSPLVGDLSVMPHLLVAGATGSGKSVGINVMLLSLMMRYTPEHVRFILVDPKMLELSVYDGVGHLMMPVVTEARKAAGALRWAIDEMERRYHLMKTYQVRNILSFNQLLAEQRAKGEAPAVAPLPFIVVVVDELADLMMTAPKDVEDSIQRLAQKARAAGIHLVLATQRPSVDVLTGVIKANLPCRLSFQVASRHDSRTILETVGAERLLGKGDMLFLPPGTNRLLRAQCGYVGDREISAVADALRTAHPAQYNADVAAQVEEASAMLDAGKGKETGAIDGDALDEQALYDRAVEFAKSAGFVSTSSIQRNFRIGYNRAARIMDRMDKEGLVAPGDIPGKPRRVVNERVPMHD